MHEKERNGIENRLDHPLISCLDVIMKIVLFHVKIKATPNDVISLIPSCMLLYVYGSENVNRSNNATLQIHLPLITR